MKFEDLNLNHSLLKAVKDQNYIHPTAIQQQAIPLVLKKHDILASAQTGTGKTAAFALPILHHLINEKSNNSTIKIRALVVTPTRELAIQIGENFTDYSK
ncbi:MAG: DEAD/DEAH box helicase, partial [Flavobacteriales bacterium]|nr:DEAD/DEAH box helicase [Flavobacteriales bacterium]